jgi:photosystem II stability/assembly factor-like uncharacterized protein
MRRWTLLLSSIVIPIALFVLILCTLGCTQTSRSERLAAATEVIVGVPTLTPAYTGDCQEAWERITTIPGPYAYLTLNAKDQANSTNSGKWTPNLPQDGLYRVEAYIPAHDPVVWCTSGRTIYSDTVDARYEIHHASGITTKSASQRTLADQWLDLGAYLFKAGSSGFVFLDDLNGEANFASTISYSAMRFTFLGATQISYFPFISKASPTATPSPGVQVSNKAGFDACTLPSISKMQTWWNTSPYWIYGLYLGGISYPDPPSCSKADATWVGAVRQQGWQFIPTWVGPQAPCSPYKNKMNSDAGIAYQQGRAEAEAAFTAAVSVGLITPNQKTVIYYDLENFGGASDACRLTAKSFINGWTERLHELGQRAGGYGSGCSSYIRDWTTIANVPDDIWAASWYTPYEYDPYASVFGVLCLDNRLWANHQRIRQYAGDHKEVWGGQSHTIDSDIADGEVAIPGVSALPAFSTAAVPSQPAIQDMGWLSEEEGWVLADGNLLWTEDGGVTWIDKTPASEELAAVSFGDQQDGWALPYTTQGEDYLVYHTSDGGSTWQVQSMPVPEGDWQPLQVSFIDPANGWASYRLMTSNIFSLGKLLKTEDGGNTWTVLDLPIGEEVFFENPLSGWTAGGAGENELYVTADGGLTWQPENPKTTNLPINNLIGSDAQIAGQPTGQVEQLTFVTAKTGWVVTAGGTCQGEKGSPDFVCQQNSVLLKTEDGGATWQAVPVPTEP